MRPNIRALLLPAILVATTFTWAEEPASAPTSAPTSQPASAPTNPADIGGGDPAFAAQHHLKPESDASLAGEMIQRELDILDKPLVGYLATPDTPLPGAPALVVIHEWWGLNKHIKQTADLLAGQGYTALAVDLYGGKSGTTPEEARALMNAVDPETAIVQLISAVQYLREEDPRRRVASIGWCFGGGYSAKLAQNDPTLDACVIFYGIVPQTAEEAGKIQAPVLGIFAGREDWISPEVVGKFEAAAKEAGVDLTVHSFDADHAFANPSNKRFNETAARAAWTETYAFFAKHLAPKQ